jgi:uncharacterized protein (UPF0264 family)
VRSTDEAEAALAGGADVIDIKEPEQGPLGAANPQTMAGIVRVVAGRAPVTAAAGELLDVGARSAMRTIESIPSSILLCKIGLRGCGDRFGWQDLWKEAAAHCRAAGNCSRLVAVVYADWAAQAPRPTDVLRVAVEHNCPALLIDTWDKSRGNLLDYWSTDELRTFITHVHSHQMAIVLAGSLSGPSLEMVAGLSPDLVAVRGAACENGRGGTVSAQRVSALKQLITSADRQSPLTASVRI